MTAEMVPALTPEEESDLARDEATIEAGLAGFMETGTALLHIKDRRLYRGTHRTFEDYLAERWHISRRRGYQLIEAAATAEAVRTIVHTPAIENEGQAREVASIVRDHGPEAAASVLRQVAESGEKPTAAAIRATAEDAGLRPRRTVVVSDQVIDTATGEIVEDATRVRVTEEPIRPTIIARPEDPAERDAHRRREWLRRLSDSAAAGYLEFDTVTHPNNLADVAEAWVSFPPVALTSGPITPDMLRATAARITNLAERLEKS